MLICMAIFKFVYFCIFCIYTERDSICCGPHSFQQVPARLNSSDNLLELIAQAIAYGVAIFLAQGAMRHELCFIHSLSVGLYYIYVCMAL